jgi:hypothetical protein
MLKSKFGPSRAALKPSPQIEDVIVIIGPSPLALQALGDEPRVMDPSASLRMIFAEISSGKAKTLISRPRQRGGRAAFEAKKALWD